LACFTDLVLLAMLVLANGAPVALQAGCGHRCAWTLDDLLRPALGPQTVVFGHHKTLRGIGAAVVASTAVAWAVDWPLWLGALVGTLAMLGDLGSSAWKRRRGVAPGGPVPGVDQIPESLLPMLGAACFLSLGPADIAAIVAGFCVLEWLLTSLWQRGRQ